MISNEANNSNNDEISMRSHNENKILKLISSINSIIDSYKKFNQSFMNDLESLRETGESILSDLKDQSENIYNHKCKMMLENLMNSFPVFPMSPERSSNLTHVLIENESNDEIIEIDRNLENSRVTSFIENEPVQEIDDIMEIIVNQNQSKVPEIISVDIESNDDIQEIHQEFETSPDFFEIEIENKRIEAIEEHLEIVSSNDESESIQDVTDTDMGIHTTPDNKEQTRDINQICSNVENSLDFVEIPIEEEDKPNNEINKDSEEIQEPNEISIPRDNTENNLKTIQNVTNNESHEINEINEICQNLEQPQGSSQILNEIEISGKNLEESKELSDKNIENIDITNKNVEEETSVVSADVADEPIQPSNPLIKMKPCKVKIKRLQMNQVNEYKNGDKNINAKNVKDKKRRVIKPNKKLRVLRSIEAPRVLRPQGR